MGVGGWGIVDAESKGEERDIREGVEEGRMVRDRLRGWGGVKKTKAKPKWVQLTSIIFRHGIVSMLCEGNIPKVQNACHNVQNVGLCLLIDAHHTHRMLHAKESNMIQCTCFTFELPIRPCAQHSLTLVSANSFLSSVPSTVYVPL